MSDAVCRDYAEITDVRASDPQAVERAWQTRAIRPAVRGNGRLMIVAADHPARGALGVGDRPTAMNSRTDLLDRLRAALADPGVDGVLATSDILDDLLLLGALEDKVVFSSMNRGGLAGAQFELDDRMTAATAAATAAARMNGGKMLCRIDLDDPGTVSTLETCARAIDELASHGLIAMVEPFMSSRVNGKVRNDLSPDAVIKSVHIGQGLGSTSAYTWMKLPVVDEMDRVMESTTLPTLLLGGDPADPDEAFASWEKALALPSVRGLIVGRTLLYPADDDVSSAVCDRRFDGEVSMHSKYYIPANSATLPYTVDVTPESAGWSEASLRVVELQPDQTLELDTDGHRGDDPAAGGRRNRRVRRRDVRTVAARIGFRRPRRHGLHRHRPELHAARRRQDRDLRGARRSDSCPTAGWPPPTCRSSCAAPATAAGRCTTSAPQASSRPTR